MNDEATNLNPGFCVELIDIKSAQDNISRCELGQKIRFIISGEGRIEAYTLGASRYLGIVAKKDTKEFLDIYENPDFFEGEVIAKIRSSRSSYKLRIIIKAKADASFRIFKEDSQALNSLVKLEEMFEVGEAIICNYGKALIVEIHSDSLLVGVPHLGNRTIYDLTSVEKYHD